MKKVKTLHESHYLGLYERDGWAFCERPNARGVVGILAITDDEEIILVEQFRKPINRRCIELPAGLVGDEEEHQDEPIAHTAARELEEETGYTAAEIKHLAACPTSPGMTSETTHLFLAAGLTKVSAGGGVEGEEITVHVIPLKSLPLFLDKKENEDCSVNQMIYASLYLRSQR